MSDLLKLAAVITGQPAVPPDLVIPDFCKLTQAERRAAWARYDAARAKALNQGDDAVKPPGPKEVQIAGLRTGSAKRTARSIPDLREKVAAVDGVKKPAKLKKLATAGRLISGDAPDVADAMNGKITEVAPPTTVDDVFAKVTAENQAAEAAVPPFTAAEAAAEADRLHKWSKGKPIVRKSSDATFWSSGRWMVKLAANSARSLAEFGYATLTGDPLKGGATLTILKPGTGRAPDLTLGPKSSTTPTADAAEQPQEDTVKRTAAKTKAPTTKKTATTARAKAPATSKAKAAASARTSAGNAPAKARPKTKADLIEELLTRKEGTTRKELSEKTGYPHVNLKMAAARAEKKLVEKDERVFLV